jgi:hypothetical protein
MGAIAILFILWAILITSILYLVQIQKFNRLLLHRYLLVNGLVSVNPRVDRVPVKEIEPDDAGDSPPGKHVSNPIYAMLDLVEEFMHEIPQIIKLLRFVIFFTVIMVFFLVFTGIVNLAFGIESIIGMDVWELILGMCSFVTLLPAIVLLLDSERLFIYLMKRHSVIDGVRFGEDIRVSSGENPLKRLVTFLMENDPYVRSSVIANKDTFRDELIRQGQSGKKYTFDAYYSGVNVLKDQSLSIDIPRGRFSIFIKVFREGITREGLERYRESVLDVCKKDGAFPLRIVALMWDIREIPDEAYDFVFDNPILWRRTLSHIQIVAEDDDVYSFIPIISYGKGTG